jgi:uncharacterized CHY-type Zn-finger protein
MSYLFKWKECRATFLSEEEIEDHMKQRERACNLFQCDKYKASFNNREELEKHILELYGGSA